MLLTEDQFPELNFPCEYPVKVMGLNDDGFIEHAMALVMRHAPELTAQDFSTRASSSGKYISVNTRFTAQSRAQVDALYSEMRLDARVVTAF